MKRKKQLRRGQNSDQALTADVMFRQEALIGSNYKDRNSLRFKKNSLAPEHDFKIFQSFNGLEQTTNVTTNINQSSMVTMGMKYHLQNRTQGTSSQTAQKNYRSETLTSFVGDRMPKDGELSEMDPNMLIPNRH